MATSEPEQETNPHFWYWHLEHQFQLARRPQLLRDVQWFCIFCCLNHLPGIRVFRRKIAMWIYNNIYIYGSVLHAFSGRRRPGDFQFFVEQIAAQDPTVAFVVLSVDIVIDPIWGNVANPKTKAFWMDAARQGLVRAFLGGPPCETWSIARGKVLAAPSKTRSSRMPRILRTAELLWGLWSTSLREKAQLMVGHELLLFSFQIMAILACTCGLGVLEHPSEPSEPNAASIWKLPLAQFLLNLPCVQRVEFSQGLMGAHSRKPTTLMTLNLPDLVHTLHCHRVTSLIPTGGSIGLSEDGSFKTGGLKEYPPALCYALASAFTAAMCVVPAEADLPATFFEQCKALVATEYGAHMGQDHAGWLWQIWNSDASDAAARLCFHGREEKKYGSDIPKIVQRLGWGQWHAVCSNNSRCIWGKTAAAGTKVSETLVVYRLSALGHVPSFRSNSPVL